MALDGSQTFFTHFSQFLCCNLRILSNLIFNPFIKIVFLSAILSNALCWSHECHHNKAAMDSPCRRGNAPLLASLHDTFHTRTPVLNIGCTIQHISYKRIVWIRDMRLEDILWCNLRRQNAGILNLNAVIVDGDAYSQIISLVLTVAKCIQNHFTQSFCWNLQIFMTN